MVGAHIADLNDQQNALVTQDYYSDGSNKTPRYYQLLAINKTIEAIAQGQNRILLVMATGTGKTFTAFQIIWRLWKSKAKETHPVSSRPQHPGRPDHDQRLQAIRLGHDQDPETPGQQILRNLPVALSGRHRHEEESNIYKQFSPDFFDLIVIDECHRGSAAEDSAWRRFWNISLPPPRSA
jgi:type I restriction enzyme, R subunit